jgi:hypothetical protein
VYFRYWNSCVFLVLALTCISGTVFLVYFRYWLSLYFRYWLSRTFQVLELLCIPGTGSLVYFRQGQLMKNAFLTYISPEQWRNYLAEEKIESEEISAEKKWMGRKMMFPGLIFVILVSGCK